jgi:porphobilinogen synthase
MSGFPIRRMRRLRSSERMRGLVRETELSASHLVMPLFVRPGKKVRKPIEPMPGNFQLSVDELVKEVAKLDAAGVPAVLLFGIPDEKDPVGTGAYDAAGIVQQAIRAIRKSSPEMLVITDVCLCEYTDHGHCGVVVERRGAKVVDNDRTLELIAKMAVSHAAAGADIVAPSDMMDGRIGAVRTALDAAGFQDTPIMSYAAKYASGFYGPFRVAAESAPQFGDRRSYQMDPANAGEAMREIALDIDEGADVVMVKPALAYLDVIRLAKETFRIPLAAYNVSGEFSMVKAAAANGWLDEKRVVMEILTGIRRAGADIIITYWAADAAKWLKEK